MDGNPKMITQEILSRRRYGRTTCVVMDRQARITAEKNTAATTVDAFVETLGFTGLGEKWAEIRLEQAKAIIREILWKDLAYRLAMMTESEASSLAERFLGLFGKGARYFTNGNVILPDADPRGVPGGSDPITTATFDTGVVCLDDTRIGILWIEDED